MQQQLVISKNPKVLQLVGTAESLIAVGKVDLAVERLREALKVEPRNDVLMQILARWCESNNEFDEPIRLLRQAAKLRPRRWDLYYDMGQIFSRYGKVNEAIKAFRKAHESGSTSSAPIVEMARLYAHCGATQERDDALRLALAKWPDDPAAMALVATGYLTAKQHAEAETVLKRILQHKIHDPQLEAYCWNKLGTAIDKQGRVSEAWEALTRGKQVRLSHEGPKPQSFIPAITANTAELSQEMILRWKSSGREATSPRFAMIAGFPRSGTTLLEVILGTHPEIATLEETYFLHEANQTVRKRFEPDQPLPPRLDEVDPETISAIRKRYMDRCRDYLGARYQCGLIIDKHPMRTHMAPFFTWMFSNAKAIIPLRDPRDIVVSNYAQDMVNSDSLTIERIVAYYEATMNAWLRIREWMGDSAIEVRYEDTVVDLQGQVTRVLRFLDLDWDPAILGFHERAKSAYVGTPSYISVAQPVNTKAVGRWRRYEAQLRPVLDRLEPFVRAFGYEPS